ncbi:MAG: aminotransferase class V-fold PLP-dependent enzyme [Ignavibacteria bacterium]|nr:MAG: aminotransferase class V-fold PLP-dependent enzyme [Ignavibacteria bacterium]
MDNLEKYFNQFRENIVGINSRFVSPYGEKRILYADWIASGRLYAPIEDKIHYEFGPFVGNTHTETSITGTAMTKAYHEARRIIKNHVNASEKDVIINAGSGMTTVVNKLQRILGLKAPEQLRKYINLPEELKPLVIITHMEHHSNHTSWLETLADVVVLEPDEQGLVSLQKLEEVLEKNKNRKLKIGSFTACSNVTGIRTDYHKMAKIMHRHGGICFVDFAASAPYVNINMHPGDPEESLDAIFFSPHKFLGGPGTAGVLIFNSNLYTRKVPDHPGGGTVDWTNPWGQHKYVDDIESREDGGTPAFLQTIKTALAIKLKEKMNPEKILQREEELLNIVWDELESIPKLHLLADMHRDRIGILSFYVEDLHYNLIVKLLNDRYGIQVRGGCSCAGTYGHYLLHVDPTRSKRITDKINKGDLSEKPGWVRLSLHPTMTDDEVRYILNAIEEIIDKGHEWEADYHYDPHTNEYSHKDEDGFLKEKLKYWFREI